MLTASVEGSAHSLGRRGDEEGGGRRKNYLEIQNLKYIRGTKRKSADFPPNARDIIYYKRINRLL